MSSQASVPMAPFGLVHAEQCHCYTQDAGSNAGPHSIHTSFRARSLRFGVEACQIETLLSRMSPARPWTQSVQSQRQQEQSTQRFGRAATVNVAISGSALGCLSSVCTHAGGLSRVPCDPGSSAVGPMSSVTSSMSTEARMRKADRSRGQQAHTMDIISRRAWLTDQPDALAVRIPRVLPHATSSFEVPQSKPGE